VLVVRHLGVVALSLPVAAGGGGDSVPGDYSEETRSIGIGPRAEEPPALLWLEVLP
jgi:hypothetical protein